MAYAFKYVIGLCELCCQENHLKQLKLELGLLAKYVKNELWKTKKELLLQANNNDMNVKKRRNELRMFAFINFSFLFVKIKKIYRKFSAIYVWIH